jgi:AcrR family transcriptional regulator
MPVLRVAPVTPRPHPDSRELIPPTPSLTNGQRATLCAALVVFAEQGFGGARMREIAAAAGVQPGNLYNHYPSKTAMLADLVFIGHQEFLRRQSSALLTCGPDPREQLTAIVRSAAVCNVTYSELIRVANYEMRHLSDDDLAPAQVCYAQVVATVEEVLSRGVEAGVFVVTDLGITILALGSLVRDVARWYPDQPLYSPDQVADELVRCALRLVGADTAEPR